MRSFIVVGLFLFFLSQQLLAGKTLIIGDSISCGHFGKHLLQKLSSQDENVTLYCTVATSPTHWVNGVNPKNQKCYRMNSAKPKLELCNNGGQVPELSRLLAEFKNERVIIALGTNSMHSDKVDKNYKTLANLIKNNGSNCIWIGPPHMNASQSNAAQEGVVAGIEKNINKFYDSLADNVTNQCVLINSKEATASQTPGFETTDGIHRTDKASKYWVENIIKQLNGQLATQKTQNSRPLNGIK